jgi:hypothetical protein
MLLATWFASTKVRRYKLFPIGQQLFFIALFSLTYEITLLLIDAFCGYDYSVVLTLARTVMGVFVWPVLGAVMVRLNHRVY